MTADFVEPGDGGADTSGGSTTEVVVVDCEDDNHCHAAGFEDAPDSIAAHHCYTTAVHAVHMWTGELLLYHGEQDQRVWPIGEGPESIRWHPVPHEALEYRSDGNAWNPGLVQPDLFCTGHVQLGGDVDGVLTGGGNVNGNPAMGGLRETYVFTPFGAVNPLAPSADAAACAYGWSIANVEGQWGNTSPRMAYDRWYPTLTVLGDGRVLIAGGTTQLLQHDPEEFAAASVAFGDNPVETPFLEIYDPTVSPATIDVLENAPFPAGDGVPQYPFMFVLPNGDVAYVGGLAADENPNVGQQTGRILVADYNHPMYDDEHDPTLWEWAPVEITSEIRGGSAVMYRPGEILKSGGYVANSNAVATPLAERIDLSQWPDVTPTAFEGTSDESAASNMRRARAFHTLTLLPDGKVLATGGNRFGNGNTGEHWNNPCRDPEPNGPLIDSLPCEDGCPSVCVDVSNPSPQTPTVCGDVAPNFQCSLLKEVFCECGVSTEDACAERGPLCGWVADECVNLYECSDLGPDFAAATCGENGRCEMACTPGEPCGAIMPLDGQCVFESTRYPGNCNPRNNACYAELTAEIYDPECNTWTELDAQDHPRMYHSTALLLPDARVISMGGGHRQGLEEQTVAEYFEPVYAGAGTGPEFRFGMPADYEAAGPDDAPLPPNYLAWETGELHVVVDNGVVPAYATLMRLGSVTHGFDMDQRALRMAVTADDDDDQYMVTVDPSGPGLTPHTVPPGHYMLFLVTAAGEPGTAQYVEVGSAATAPAEYVCEVTGAFEAVETSCSVEPVSGICPSGGVVTTSLDPPTADGPSGPVDGFNVLLPASLAGAGPDLPDATIAAVTGYCAHACDASYGDEIGQSANCDDPGVFAAPVRVADASMTLDLVGADHRHGEDLFAGQTVACDLGVSCHDAFDESLRMAAPSRVTPAHDADAKGEEFRMTVTGSMGIDSPAASGPVNGALTGTVGFSHCAAGNASAACPFYLGSLALELSDPMVVPLECDGGTQTFEVESMTIELAQPAFGVAQQGTLWKAFPPGSLILEGAATVNGVPFTWRRPNEEPVYAFVTDGWIQVQGIGGAWIEFNVPCGEESADVLVWWGFQTSGAIGTPPSITITAPSSVTCPSTVTLAHTKWDAQNDIVSTRWLVDGVLMAPGTTSVPFTTGHTLTAVVRDSRGATRTKTKAVTCQ